MITAPITLGSGETLKNRIAKAAMTEGLADASNRATLRHETLYRRWAKGGAGLLLTGNVQIDRRYLERPGNIAIDGPQSEEQIGALKKLAKAATDEGAGVWMQISHAGRQSPKIVAREPVGPSAVALKLPGGQFGKPRALTESEIEDVIARFAFAVSAARDTGFTGAQIHSAHGYLLSEFLNPLANQRTDRWGGVLENRARLLIETVRAVRKVAGGRFSLSVKLNSSDFQKGGYSFDDCLKVVKWIDNEGVDLLEISGGSYEQPRMMGLDGLEPPLEDRRLSTRRREAYFLHYAEEIAKAALTPLMVTGGFRTLAGMEAALASGAAAVIGVARPLCVDPDLPRKLLAHKIDALPAFESSLRIGGGYFGPNSPNAFIKALNGFSSMAFYYENINRLADGAQTSSTMALLPAFIRHQAAEARAARALR